MTFIKRNTQVPHSPRQMFELVNAIEDYPRFLPWCKGSHVLHRDDQAVEATLDIVWSGIQKSFTTRNTLFPYDKIDIALVSGPFRSLNGSWHFVPIDAGGCQVELTLNFELAGHFFDKLFQPIFYHIADSLVGLFCKRAVDIYGLHDR